MKCSVIYRYILFFFIGLGLSCCPYSAFSHEGNLQPESDLNRVIRKIKEKEKTLKTFTATFKQTKMSELLREPLRSEGLIYFDMSVGILMNVIVPSPLILLLKENRLIVYYPDLSRVEAKTFGKTDDMFRQYFGIGESAKTLKTRFEIELVEHSPSMGYHLKMTPKNNITAKHILMIEVLVNPDHWLPEQIHFKEKNGDFTTIQMRFTSVNEPLPSNTFEIDMPEDR